MDKGEGGLVGAGRYMGRFSQPDRVFGTLCQEVLVIISYNTRVVYHLIEALK